MKLRDKVVIVTGSTTGIGKSIAVRCVEEGARVVIHGLESDLAEQVLKSLPSGSTAVQIEDISSPKAADKHCVVRLRKTRLGSQQCRLGSVV